MHEQTLLQSFNNNNTTTEKKETKNTNTKRKKKIGNNIQWDNNLLDTKMENYKEQYTKKKEKRIEIDCLRTGIHGGNS